MSRCYLGKPGCVRWLPGSVSKWPRHSFYRVFTWLKKCRIKMTCVWEKVRKRSLYKILPFSFCTKQTDESKFKWHAGLYQREISDSVFHPTEYGWLVVCLCFVFDEKASRGGTRPTIRVIRLFSSALRLLSWMFNLHYLFCSPPSTGFPINPHPLSDDQ